MSLGFRKPSRGNLGEKMMYKSDTHTESMIGTIIKDRRNENKDKCNKRGRFRMTFVAGYNVSQLCECSYVELKNI